MFKVKIFGAGSIGNHLAQASRTKGWEVTICDLDPAALERTRKEIYPQRYGAWDEAIRLVPCAEDGRDDYDIYVIGTPPDSHIPIALDILKNAQPKLVLIEKPLCQPSLEGAQELYELAQKTGVKVCVGYDHTLGQNTAEAEKLLAGADLGGVQCLEAGIKEHWGGIFGAHPWLSGPQDTYLGYWQRGGGATGEHSHGINIWQHFAHALGKGRVVRVSAAMDIVQDGRAEYDRVASLSLTTDQGLFGYVVQDVVTKPVNKYLRVQGRDGFLTWHVNFNPAGDAVFCQFGPEPARELMLPKKRTDDFRREVDHLEAYIEGRIAQSPISLERGLDTMMVIAAAYRSAREGRAMVIDYAAGYRPEAIKPA